MSRVVSFEGLWCVFEHRSGQLVNALHDVNFEVQPGEFVCVVGRSGTGRPPSCGCWPGFNRRPPARYGWEMQ